MEKDRKHGIYLKATPLKIVPHQYSGKELL